VQHDASYPREEPGAGNLHARIREGESRMAELLDQFLTRLAAMLAKIDYDLCVFTGDYRAQTFGPYEPALAGMARICSALKGPIYGVLGNHDTIRMVPGLEVMGIQMLLNENHCD